MSGGTYAARPRWLIVLGLMLTLGACDGSESGAPADSATADSAPADAHVEADAAVDAADALDGAPDADLAAADAPESPASDFDLILGLGERAFAPTEHGAVALLQRGCQGAQHIWISLRSPDLAPGPYLMTLSARQTDGQEAIPAHQLEFDWVAVDGGGAELVGVQLVVFDPLAVVDAHVDVFAEVPAGDGRIGRAVRRLRVEWGPDDC